MEEVEDRNMTNVQEPVKDMLLMLTKDSRAAQASIRDLNVKVDQLTKEFVLGVVAEFMRDSDANKENYVREVGKKQHQQLQEQVAALEEKLLASSLQVNRMNEIMQHQSAAITDLNRRLEGATSEIEGMVLRSVPSDEHVLSRIDLIERKLDDHRAETDRRLTDRAEQEAVSRLSPLRTEELLRSLSNQVADLRSEVDRKASKDQFHALSEGKVDNNEYINLLASVHEKISMTQLTAAVNNQVKPLTVAVAALEKAVVIQSSSFASSPSSSSSSASSSVQDHMDRKVGPAWETAMRQASASGGDSAATKGGGGLDVGRVTDLVESLLQSHRINEVTQMGLERALEQQHDGLLRETGATIEYVRSEVLALCKDRISAHRQQLEGKLAEALGAVDAGREQLHQVQRRMQDQEQQALANIRELAESTSKALQKKADRSELKSEVEKISARVEEQADSLLAAENSRVAELDAFFDASDRTPQRHDNASSEGTSPIRPVRLSSATTVTAAARGSRIPSYTPRKSQALEAINELESMDREAEQLRKSLASLKARAEKAEVESASLKAALALKSEALAAAETRKQTASSPPTSSSNSANTEWRLALGELGTSLRRELSDKMSRSEFPDILRLDNAIKEMQREMAKGKGESSDLAKLSRSFATLQSRVISELTGALWLWTSRQLLGEDCVVPWDEQVVNAAPHSLLWRKGSGILTIRLPGLYRLSLAVFTCMPVQLTLYLNDEPLLVLQPDAAANPEAFSLSSYLNAQAHRDQKYCTRRLRHSAGDVTAVALEEPLSLPADAVLSVRFHSAGMHAQAMLSLRKL